MRKKIPYLTLLLLLAFLAGCGELPSAPVGQEATAAPPTVATEPPTEAPTPPADAPPPTPIQPTPYAPAEALPEGFPTIVYAVQQWGQPGQIWTLRYQQGLLREEPWLDLGPASLQKQERIDPRYTHVGGGWVSVLSASPDVRHVAVTLRDAEDRTNTLILGTDGEMYMPLMPADQGAKFLAWIPGTERVVVSDRDGMTWGTMAVDGTDYIQFPFGDVLRAVVSSDGGRVIFSAIPTTGGAQLGIIATDGTSLTTFDLSDPLPGYYVKNLALSPDGRQCALVWEWNINFRGAGQLWLIDADGTNHRPLGPGDTYDFGPAWSPDGRTLAFVRRENPQAQILGYDPTTWTALVSSLWLVDVDGSGERLLLSSEGQFAHWSPEWLPDGSGLVFVSDRGGENDLWLVRADGSGLQQLTRQGGLLSPEIAVLGR